MDHRSCGGVVSKSISRVTPYTTESVLMVQKNEGQIWDRGKLFFTENKSQCIMSIIYRVISILCIFKKENQLNIP